MGPRHRKTRATVVRAGRTTTMVSLADWFGGQLLAPADTSTIQALIGRPREELPDVELWVMARLDAQAAEFLALRGWTPCEEPAKPSGKDERKLRVGKPVQTVRPTRAA